jgi:hypothetical protein
LIGKSRRKCDPVPYCRLRDFEVRVSLASSTPLSLSRAVAPSRARARALSRATATRQACQRPPLQGGATFKSRGSRPGAAASHRARTRQASGQAPQTRQASEPGASNADRGRRAPRTRQASERQTKQAGKRLEPGKQAPLYHGRRPLPRQASGRRLEPSREPQTGREPRTGRRLEPCQYLERGPCGRTRFSCEFCILCDRESFRWLFAFHAVAQVSDASFAS